MCHLFTFPKCYHYLIAIICVYSVSMTIDARMLAQKPVGIINVTLTI